MGEIGEGFHGANTGLALKLRAQGFEIELSFEVMHAGLKKRFAVQAAPQADGAEGLPLGQWIVREIDEQFIGREIDVVEGDDVRDGLFENLRAPAGFAACVEALTQDEAELCRDA